jgi:hypothetical protein
MGVLSVVENLTHRALAARGVQSRWVDTSVARLHAYDAPGRGPLGTVAVLHGISSSAAAYGSLIQRLRGALIASLPPTRRGTAGAGIRAWT